MSRHLIGLFALLLSLLPAASAAVAAPSAPGSAVYDTIDAVEVFGDRITITGIIVGQSNPSEFTYQIVNSPNFSEQGGAARCDRLAMMAMAKPGKYQFAIPILPGFGGRFSCKLIVRAP